MRQHTASFKSSADSFKRTLDSASMKRLELPYGKAKGNGR